MRAADRAKFVRLANNRVNKAIKSIRLIGNLSNRSNYDFTDDDVRQILRALEGEIKSCRQRFEQPSSTNNEAFELK